MVREIYGESMPARALDGITGELMEPVSGPEAIIKSAGSSGWQGGLHSCLFR